MYIGGSKGKEAGKNCCDIIINQPGLKKNHEGCAMNKNQTNIVILNCNFVDIALNGIIVIFWAQQQES